MRLSIIWKLTERDNYNQKTLESLKKQTQHIQLLIYGNEEAVDKWKEEAQKDVKEVQAFSKEAWTDGDIYQHASDIVSGDWVTQLNGGDVWSEGAIAQLEKALETQDANIAMFRKVLPEETPATFARAKYTQDAVIRNLESEYNVFPFYFGGTFVKTELLKAHTFRPELGLEVEREFFLTICVKERKVLYLSNSTYHSADSREGDITFYKGIYDTKWYEESFREFWLPFLANLKKMYGYIPKFVQYNLMFSICSRIDSNLDNRNKHVIEEGREQICIDYMSKVLQYVSDDVMLNMHKILQSVARSVD